MKNRRFGIERPKIQPSNACREGTNGGISTANVKGETSTLFFRKRPVRARLGLVVMQEQSEGYVSMIGNSWTASLRVGE
jgi:hypothetical protein